MGAARRLCPVATASAPSACGCRQAALFLRWLFCLAGPAVAAQQAEAGEQRAVHRGLSSRVVTWSVGPRVDSSAYLVYCQVNPAMPLEFAIRTCEADVNCLAIHSADCEHNSWRVCSSTIDEIQAAGPGTDACTMVVSVITTATTSVTTVTQNPAPHYVDGPKIDNSALLTHCNPGTSSLAVAVAACDAREDCSVVLSYQCLNWAWTFCTSSLSTLLAHSTEQNACSKVLVVTTTPTSMSATTTSETTVTTTATTGTTTTITTLTHTATTVTTATSLTATTTTRTSTTRSATTTTASATTGTSTASSATTTAVTATTTTVTRTMVTTALLDLATYVDGPMVVNSPDGVQCSKAGTLSEAQAACFSVQGCTVLHSYNCEDFLWRACSGSVASILDQGSGPACTKVDPRYVTTETSSTSTVTSATTSLTTSVTPRPQFVDGPMVVNSLDGVQCSKAGTLAQAEAACDAMEGCAVLHSYSCEDFLWRACAGSVASIVEQGTGPACTKVDPRFYVSTSSNTRTITAMGTVTAVPVWASTITTTSTRLIVWIPGPRVDNGAGATHCVSGVASLEEAAANCESDPACTVLHSYKCLDWAWRHCSGTIDDLVDVGPGAESCTMVIAPDTTTVTATTTTTVGFYLDGPMVASMVYMDHCAAVPTSLEDAKEACDADPECYALHSFDCLDWAWRPCTGSLEVLLAAGPGTSCLKVHSSAENAVTTTTVSTATSQTATSTTTLYWVDAPRMSNDAAGDGRCSPIVTTLDGAIERCNQDPTCSGVLHSYKCFDWAWRYCTTSFDALAAVGTDSDACTKVQSSLTTATGTTVSTTTVTTESFTFSTTTTSTTTTVTTISLTMTSGTRTTTTRTSMTTTTTTLYFVDGPRVGNSGWQGHCSSSVFTLEAATTACKAAEGCLVLHSFACEDWAWRYCTSGILEIQAEDPGTQACSKVELQLITSTSSATTTSATHTTVTTSTRTSTTVTVTGTSVTTSATTKSMTSTSTTATSVTTHTLTSSTLTATTISATTTSSVTTMSVTTTSATHTSSSTHSSTTETTSSSTTLSTGTATETSTRTLTSASSTSSTSTSATETTLTGTETTTSTGSTTGTKTDPTSSTTSTPTTTSAITRTTDTATSFTSSSSTSGTLTSGTLTTGSGTTRTTTSRSSTSGTTTSITSTSSSVTSSSITSTRTLTTQTITSQSTVSHTATSRTTTSPTSTTSTATTRSETSSGTTASSTTTSATASSTTTLSATTLSTTTLSTATSSTTTETFSSSTGTGTTYSGTTATLTSSRTGTATTHSLESTSTSGTTTSSRTSTTASTTTDSSTSSVTATSSSQTTSSKITVSLTSTTSATAPAATVTGNLTLQVANASVLMADPAARESLRTAIASVAGVQPRQVIGLEVSAPLRRRRLWVVDGPSTVRSVGYSHLHRTGRHLSAQTVVTVVYTIAVGESDADTVAQTLQDVSPADMEVTLRRTLAEAGIDDEYSEFSVISHIVTDGAAPTQATTPTNGDADETDSGSATAVAILASLVGVFVCGCLTVFAARNCGADAWISSKRSHLDKGSTRSFSPSVVRDKRSHDNDDDCPPLGASEARTPPTPHSPPAPQREDDSSSAAADRERAARSLQLLHRSSDEEPVPYQFDAPAAASSSPAAGGLGDYSPRRASGSFLDVDAGSRAPAGSSGSTSRSGRDTPTSSWLDAAQGAPSAGAGASPRAQLLQFSASVATPWLDHKPTFETSAQPKVAASAGVLQMQVDRGHLASSSSSASPPLPPSGAQRSLVGSSSRGSFAPGLAGSQSRGSLAPGLAGSPSTGSLAPAESAPSAFLQAAPPPLPRSSPGSASPCPPGASFLPATAASPTSVREWINSVVGSPWHSNDGQDSVVEDVIRPPKASVRSVVGSPASLDPTGLWSNRVAVSLRVHCDVVHDIDSRSESDGNLQWL